MVSDSHAAIQCRKQTNDSSTVTLEKKLMDIIFGSIFLKNEVSFYEGCHLVNAYYAVTV